MNINRGAIALALSVSIASVNVQAQDAHPFLDSTFIFGAGAFFPTQGLDLEANGTIPGDDIDFDSALGVDDSQVTPVVSLRWNMTDRWSMWGLWWKTSSSGSETLDEDIVWDDITFKAGTNIEAGADTDVLRFLIGYELVSGPQYEFGIGIGMHWMDLSAYIQGQVLTDMGESDFRRGEASVNGPLPDVGAWYFYSPSARWLLTARVDWFSASVGKYDGSLWDAAVGANYQLSEHFGIALEYVFFSLDVNIDDGDWQGGAKVRNNGPVLALTANW